jgi:hypothetical protein
VRSLCLRLEEYAGGEVFAAVALAAVRHEVGPVFCRTDLRFLNRFALRTVAITCEAAKQKQLVRQNTASGHYAPLFGLTRKRPAKLKRCASWWPLAGARSVQ